LHEVSSTLAPVGRHLFDLALARLTEITATPCAVGFLAFTLVREDKTLKQHEID
jgi:hypothetical protein